jgi:anti-sigma regulatory factor (Ser/Thr protein kinase)
MQPRTKIITHGLAVFIEVCVKNNDQRYYIEMKDKRSWGPGHEDAMAQSF